MEKLPALLDIYFLQKSKENYVHSGPDRQNRLNMSICDSKKDSVSCVKINTVKSRPAEQECVRDFKRMTPFLLMSQQFVPFRDYMDRTGNHVLSMARLAKDVLAEIPEQLISYMKRRAIKPNPVPPAYSTCAPPETESV